MPTKINNQELSPASIASNTNYQLAFSYFNKIGPVTLEKLRNYFPTLKDAWQATTQELIMAGLRENLANEFHYWQPSFNLDQTLNDLEKQGIDYTCLGDQSYPSSLKDIFDPPIVLYYKGQIPPEYKNRLAVVGSRQPSAYAEKIITWLLPALIQQGLEIISGLALGTDTLAHRETLNQGGITLAVLGSGLSQNNIYPASNRNLAQEIIDQGGALISEFPADRPPLKLNFPRRNRLISGLSQATLIIEAKAKSGTLITANHALEQGREVLVVPGNIFSPTSEGTNNLIKAGAYPITDVNDILEIFKLKNYHPTELNPASQRKKSIVCSSAEDLGLSNKTESLIYNIIKKSAARAETISADEIIKETKLSASVANSALSLLEIKGLVKNTESGYDLN